jgi:hypothetical protein
MLRLCRNSSSRPSPVERGASRDPGFGEFNLFFWIPDLSASGGSRDALHRLSGMMVSLLCDTVLMGGHPPGG